ncbi:MAG: OmpA family protein [Crocinitomicaceae bacterium]|nr:OmpA family protein [Crocinitomicaceae bacterium]
MKVYCLLVAICSVYSFNALSQGPMRQSAENGNGPNQAHYTVEKSPLSSDDHTDFGAYVNNGKLYFLSDRKAWPVEWKDENEQPFLDLFEVDLESGLKSEFAGPRKNGKFNEGPICFSKDGKRVYYTRDYDGKKGREGIDGTINLGIFTAVVKGDKWMDEKRLSINNFNYSVGHPVITNDGKYLIFSSDMPGGKGGSDIYRAPILEDGDVGSAESLPGEVNTPGHELFPAIGSNDEIYFSSNGHESIGGLDIFMALLKKDFYIRVTTVGYPINSAQDDFAYSPGEGNKGYFSTNRDGNDDIYSFNQIIPFRFVPLLAGSLTIEETNSKEGVLVEVMDQAENVLQSQTTDSKGNYAFDLEEEKQYLVRFSMEGYDPVIVKTSTKGDGFGLKNDFQMKKDNGVEISLQLIAAKTELAVEGAIVRIIDNKTNKVFIRRLSDPEGKIMQPMLELKEGDSLDLTIKIAKEGYLSKEVRFQYSVESMQDISLDEIYGNALKMHRAGLEEGIDLSSMTDVEQLLFATGSSAMDFDIARELDKIVAFMKDNKKIRIRVRSHTDSRGDDKENLKLSKERAKVIVNYFIEEGISSGRISGTGMGEKEIINHCRDGIECTEKEHLQNARTEYIITKS